MKHSPARLRASRRAFTLIEMLVVIAIIGILSAILFPVFSRARENGRKISCLSNMKQLGTAFLLYQQDARKYPLAANYQAWTKGNGHWVTGEQDKYLAALTPDASGDFPYQSPNKADVQSGALFPYVKSTAVYVCPSNRDGQMKGLSYSMNCAVSGLAGSKITSPTDIVVLVDEQYSTDGFFWAVNDAGSTDKLTQVHNGGGNLLFADGHAKFFPFDSFIIDKSTEGLANKTRMTGSPRFHDRAFGSATGSSLVPFEAKPGEIKPGGDSCAITPVAPTTPVTPTTP